MAEKSKPRHLVEIWAATYEQRQFLLSETGGSSHLRAVAILNDKGLGGVDYLVVDDDQPYTATGHIHGHYGPYVLTSEGLVLDVNKYYNLRYGLSLPYSDY